MEKDYLIRLTLEIYRATESWGEEKLLKFKIRGLANEILTDFILFFSRNPSGNISQFLEKIEKLQKELGEARAQKLLNRNKFLLFKREYNKVGEELKILSFSKKIVKEEPEKVLEELNERQKKILEILAKKEKVQVWELKEFFGKTSKRTLRRDLEALLKKGMVERDGEWNQVFYKLSRLGHDRTQLGQNLSYKFPI